MEATFYTTLCQKFAVFDNASIHSVYSLKKIWKSSKYVTLYTSYKMPHFLYSE